MEQNGAMDMGDDVTGLEGARIGEFVKAGKAGSGHHWHNIIVDCRRQSDWKDRRALVTEDQVLFAVSSCESEEWQLGAGVDEMYEFALSLYVPHPDSYPNPSSDAHSMHAVLIHIEAFKVRKGRILGCTVSSMIMIVIDCTTYQI
jgi:hypothetical protein